MARVTIKAGDDYALKLSKLATGSENIAKKAIYAAAGIVTDAIKESLLDVLSPSATGELADSLGIATMDHDKTGWNTKIGFDGYDKKGVPNQVKARVLESGSSRQKKRPFVRPALKATKKKAEDAMAKIVDEEIKKIMK